MDYTSPVGSSLLASLYKKSSSDTIMFNHKQNMLFVHLFSDIPAQTNWSISQAIWKTVLFSHLPTYNDPHPPAHAPPVCLLFESFISVASSTVFHRVKIEAIILPNAYLPALYATSCTRRLLHDEVADMFHTHHPLPYVQWVRLSLRSLY